MTDRGISYALPPSTVGSADRDNWKQNWLDFERSPTEGGNSVQKSENKKGAEALFFSGELMNEALFFSGELMNLCGVGNKQFVVRGQQRLMHRAAFEIGAECIEAEEAFGTIQ